MFRCHHCGGCCEDVATQINLTLGDVKRLCDFTGKNALLLYKEGIIGVQPFGDPFKNDEYETDIGLFIPCVFRSDCENNTTTIKNKNKKITTTAITCSVYPARPINCRLFPYWILAEAPPKEIKTLICAGHECMKHLEIDEDFMSMRKEYHEYKEKLVKILFDEGKVTDEFYLRIGLKKKMKVKPTTTKDDDALAITRLVKKLSKNDYSDVFKKIDDEMKRHVFVKAEDMPEPDF